MQSRIGRKSRVYPWRLISLSAAITVGRLDVAKQAALYLLSKPDAPPIARRMAGVCVGAADGTAGIVSGVEAIHAHPFSLTRPAFLDS